jgi:carbonic anhydrase
MLAPYLLGVPTPARCTGFARSRHRRAAGRIGTTAAEVLLLKLRAGIVDFHRNIRPSYRERFARLALGQSPDSLFIACSDSRVVPNLFASTEPGDLFVVRNVGNMVPPCGADGRVATDHSEGAAIEFATNFLSVQDIVVCGHSECGAIRAIATGFRPPASPNLADWLDAASTVLNRPDLPTLDPELSPLNRLSQLSVLQQVENLATYPSVRERLAAGELRIHAWWFDLAEAEVLEFQPESGQFTVIGG